jgi:hypothetical protein
MPGADLRAARANRVFHTDEKRIRMENTVIDKSKGGSGWLLYKIVDCARMCFSSVRNRGSARTASRPRNIAALQYGGARFRSPSRICMTRLRQMETWAKAAPALQSLPRERSPVL